MLGLSISNAGNSALLASVEALKYNRAMTIIAKQRLLRVKNIAFFSNQLTLPYFALPSYIAALNQPYVVEGTGTYGAVLARVLREQGSEVLEVSRPNRSKRHLRGKSDPTDAENAARAVLAGEATAIPKSQSGAAEALRTVSMAGEAP